MDIYPIRDEESANAIRWMIPVSSTGAWLPTGRHGPDLIRSIHVGVREWVDGATSFSYASCAPFFRIPSRGTSDGRDDPLCRTSIQAVRGWKDIAEPSRSRAPATRLWATLRM